ncbi:SH3 domain-containing protein [Parathermosynechococcus lividus]|nr:SH3 domain-containing protein [Synechococcus sp. PCC 6716]
MKPLRLLQWLLGTLLGLGLIATTVAVIITPLIFGLLWAPPRPNVEVEQPLPTAQTETSPPTPSPAPVKQGRVTYAEGLRVRDRPDREAEALGSIDFEEVVTILERSSDGEWVKVRTQNDLEGWVLAFGIQEQ